MIEKMQRGEGGDPGEPLGGSGVSNPGNPYRVKRNMWQHGELMVASAVQSSIALWCGGCCAFG